jgi:hypothetical protein
MNILHPDTLIKNPAGCEVAASITLPAKAREVWQVVGDFAGFHHFIPAIERIEMTGEGVGSLRKKFFKEGGHIVVEQLNSRDDQAMTMTWTTLYNTLDIGNLWASMKVVTLPNDSGCTATWTIHAEPAELAGFLQAFAEGAMDNVLKRFA